MDALQPSKTGLPLKAFVAWNVAILLAYLPVMSGCSGISTRERLLGKAPSIDGIRGPAERRMLGVFGKSKASGVDENGVLLPVAGTEDYVKAEALYENGQYAEAEKAFRKICRKYKKSDIREDALFMQAQAAIKQQRLSKANDIYAILLKDYPSTRHLDTVSGDLFMIAKTWLAYPELTKINEVQQVNFEEPGRPLPAPEKVDEKVPSALVPNVTNKSKPLFDPEGNAVAALRAIWLNDPTGPLADDAIMLTASHYARRGKWVEADRHFDMLREEYPQSPHVQNSFVLGSHVKLMSYEGPAYDDRRLMDAEQLKETTLRLYPNLPEKERIQKELLQIREAEAQRYWDLVQLYERKAKPRSAAVYCHLVLDKYPDSKFAPLARTVLERLGPEYVDGSSLKQAVPDKPRPTVTTWESMTRRPLKPGDVPAKRESARSSEVEVPVEEAEEAPAKQAEPRRGWWSIPRFGKEPKPIESPNGSDPADKYDNATPEEMTVSGEEEEPSMGRVKF
jgi:outer membrane protein assembly factor BamD (BamD/ComL family)